MGLSGGPSAPRPATRKPSCERGMSALAIGLPPAERNPHNKAYPWLTVDNIPDTVTAVCVSLGTDIEVKHSGWALVVNGKAYITQVLWVCTSGVDKADPLCVKEIQVTIHGLRRISGRRSQPLCVAKGRLHIPMGHSLVDSELHATLGMVSRHTQIKTSTMTGNQLFGPRHLVLESLSVR